MCIRDSYHKYLEVGVKIIRLFNGSLIDWDKKSMTLTNGFKNTSERIRHRVFVAFEIIFSLLCITQFWTMTLGYIHQPSVAFKVLSVPFIIMVKGCMSFKYVFLAKSQDIAFLINSLIHYEQKYMK